MTIASARVHPFGFLCPVTSMIVRTFGLVLFAALAVAPTPASAQWFGPWGIPVSPYGPGIVPTPYGPAIAAPPRRRSRRVAVPVVPAPPVGEYRYRGFGADVRVGPFGSLSVRTPGFSMDSSPGVAPALPESADAPLMGREFVAEMLDAAERLESSLVNRDDGDVWIDYLAPSRVADLVRQWAAGNGVSREVSERKTAFDGVVANGQLRWLRSLPGFETIRRGLGVMVEGQPASSAAESRRSGTPTPAPQVRAGRLEGRDNAGQDRSSSSGRSVLGRAIDSPPPPPSPIEPSSADRAPSDETPADMPADAPEELPAPPAAEIPPRRSV